MSGNLIKWCFYFFFNCAWKSTWTSGFATVGLKSCTGLLMILTIWEYKHGNGSGKRPRDVISELYKKLFQNSEGRSSTGVPVLLYLNKVWFLPSYTPCLYRYWFLTRENSRDFKCQWIYLCNRNWKWNWKEINQQNWEQIILSSQFKQGIGLQWWRFVEHFARNLGNRRI